MAVFIQLFDMRDHVTASIYGRRTINRINSSPSDVLCGGGESKFIKMHQRQLIQPSEKDTQGRRLCQSSLPAANQGRQH